MENNNLPVISNPTISLPALENPQEVMEIMQENAERGMMPDRFPEVKIPSGGGLAFEVPGDNPEEPDSVKELEGVILDHYPVNAYWPAQYSGENNPPACSSMDGKIGQAAEDAPVDWAGSKRDCATCPFNQWGSAADGRGKACKNMHRVYLLREGEIFPILLTLPPTSIPHFKTYIVRLTSKLKRFYGVITKIKLKKAQNKGGITYSEAIFGKAKELTPEEVEAMKSLSSQLKSAMRNVAIEADIEQAAKTTSANTGNGSVQTEDEDIM